jgi:hypothetical protein
MYSPNLQPKNIGISAIFFHEDACHAAHYGKNGSVMEVVSSILEELAYE